MSNCMTMVEGISATHLQIGRIEVKEDEAEKSVWTHTKGLIIIRRRLVISCRLQGTEV